MLVRVWCVWGGGGEEEGGRLNLVFKSEVWYG